MFFNYMSNQLRLMVELAIILGTMNPIKIVRQVKMAKYTNSKFSAF